ncbi:hypothetical protein [Dokdonella sp.]|uniref:hypothetical protein n=1 Tax=Dokdonella sp. TaxID=2291710 RepID=UPI003527F8AA
MHSKIWCSCNRTSSSVGSRSSGHHKRFVDALLVAREQVTYDVVLVAVVVVEVAGLMPSSSAM